LSEGDDSHWTTGWFSSKHELGSGRVTHQPGGRIAAEVSVTDDFDTQGIGIVTDVDVSGFTPEFALENIRGALEQALADAVVDQTENRTVELYTVGRQVRLDGAPAGPRWEQTYLVDTGPFPTDVPPWDSYHRWGWADVEDDSDLDELIPPATREALERGMQALEDRVQVGEWIAQRSR